MSHIEQHKSHCLGLLGSIKEERRKKEEFSSTTPVDLLASPQVKNVCPIKGAWAILPHSLLQGGLRSKQHICLERGTPLRGPANTLLGAREGGAGTKCRKVRLTDTMTRRRSSEKEKRGGNSGDLGPRPPRSATPIESRRRLTPKLEMALENCEHD